MSLYPTPSADFDHQIDILDGCHQRIRRNCDVIERLAAHLLDKGADAEARVAALNVMRFFDTAGSNHHRDEEDDLFPALQHHVPSEELNALFSLLHRLRADHRKLDGLWAEMHRCLTGIIQGRDGGLTGERAREFTAAYQRHIELEEAELLPIARRVLDERMIAALGGSMARRRGVAHAG